MNSLSGYLHVAAKRIENDFRVNPSSNLINNHYGLNPREVEVLHQITVSATWFSKESTTLSRRR